MSAELLLGGFCLNRIVPKIEEYREFFGTFHEVMLQLMSVLGKFSVSLNDIFSLCIAPLH